MEENRINRRARPRPYDLRRKVLLKNFLREQMTFIPGTQFESFSSNDDNNNDSSEPAISLNLDEVTPELNDENISSATSTELQCPSFSSNNADLGPTVIKMEISSEENSKDSQSSVQESSDSSRSSSLNKITSLMKLRSGSKKKQRGIVKAKDAINGTKSPTKSKRFKRGLERVFSRKKTYESSPQIPKYLSRSLFSLFKNRRAQRKADDANRTKNSPYENQKSFGYRSKHTHTNHSNQTDDTWLRQALLKEQQSNRLLREENRILSESLSYFMSGSSMDSQCNPCNQSTLQLPNEHSYSKIYHDKYSPSNTSNGWNHRTKVVRSKSVQHHRERKTSLRNSYLTRSMNCHNGRNKVLLPDPNKFLLPDPNKTLLPDPNKSLLPDPNKTLLPDPNKTLLPDPNKALLPDLNKTLLPDPSKTLLPDPNKALLRDPNKALMQDPKKVLLPDPKKVLLPDPKKVLLPDPKKVLLPDPKKVLFSDHNPHTPMYSSHEGYNPRQRRKTILANLPVNSAVRGIQRRSSMPERILSENDRSLTCRRTGSFRDAYNRKPFHLLPSEVFY